MCICVCSPSDLEMEVSCVQIPVPVSQTPSSHICTGQAPHMHIIIKIAHKMYIFTRFIKVFVMYTYLYIDLYTTYGLCTYSQLENAYHVDNDSILWKSRILLQQTERGRDCQHRWPIPYYDAISCYRSRFSCLVLFVLL